MLLTNSVGIRGGGIFPATLTALVLAWISDSNDSTPNFTMDLYNYPVAGDIVTLEWTAFNVTNPDGSFPAKLGVATATVDANGYFALQLSETIGILDNGTYYFHGKHIRGTAYSLWSNTVIVTISVFPFVQRAWPDPVAKQQSARGFTSFFTV